MRMVMGIVMAVFLASSAGASTAESAQVQYNKALPVKVLSPSGDSTSSTQIVTPQSGAVFTVTWTGGFASIENKLDSALTALGNYAPFTTFYPYPLPMTVTDTGTWVDLHGYKSCTCVVKIDGALGAGTGATVYITMSETNTGSVPTGSYHGITAGTAITASGIYPYDGIAGFFKLRISDNNTATVSAGCVGRKQ